MDDVAKVLERAVAIGPRNALIGIVTHAPAVETAYPSVVVLNGGILPRAGRSRPYVTLARRLAPRGFRILRFDLSGIGDSPSRDDGLPPTSAAVADVTEALDWFVGKDGPVVLIGLCDGANLAAYQAARDPRVVGAVLVDPLIPRTRRYRLLHSLRRLCSLVTWREIVLGQHPAWRLLRARAGALAGAEPALTILDPNHPEVRSTLAGIYANIAEADLPVLALFSGGMQHRHCYREQIFEAFPDVAFGSRFEAEYFQANDHHFEWPPHREWFLKRLADWLTTTPFPARSPAPVDSEAAA